MSDFDLKSRASTAMENYIANQRAVLSNTDLSPEAMLRLQGKIQGMVAALNLLQDAYKGLHG